MLTIYGNEDNMNERQLKASHNLPQEGRLYVAYAGQAIHKVKFLYVLEPCIWLGNNGEIVQVTAELLNDMQTALENNIANQIHNDIVSECKLLCDNSKFLADMLIPCVSWDEYKNKLDEYIEKNNTFYFYDNTREQYIQASKYDLRTAGTYHATVPYRAKYKSKTSPDTSYFSIYQQDLLDTMRRALLLNFYLENKFEWDFDFNSDVRCISFEEYTARVKGYTQ